MSREKEHGTTLEEIEAAGGKRLPKSKRFGLKKSVEMFLEEVFSFDFEKAKKMSQVKEREIQAEIRGYAKAQEHLREIIAMGGTDAIAELAEVRTEGQMRPKIIGNMRAWMG